jgi:hypothetical protein
MNIKNNFLKIKKYYFNIFLNKIQFNYNHYHNYRYTLINLRRREQLAYSCLFLRFKSAFDKI